MLSNNTLAVLAVVGSLVVACIWVAAALSGGHFRPPEAIDTVALLRDIGFTSAGFGLLLISAFLPVKRTVAARLTAGALMLFLGAWHLLLTRFITSAPPFLMYAGALTLPLGTFLLALGVYEFGKLYRLNRLMLGSYRQIEHNLATVDQVTQLFNRRYFFSNCPELLNSGRRQGDSAILICLTLTNLPEVNERLGYSAGDSLLSELGRVVARYTRRNDIAARIGGQRVALFLPRANLQAAGLIVQRLNEQAQNIQLASQTGERIAQPAELECRVCQARGEESFDAWVSRTLAAPIYNEQSAEPAEAT